MQQVTINITNPVKAHAFLAFLKQLDFVNVVSEKNEPTMKMEDWKTEFSKIGVWDIDENDIKLKNWKIEEF